MPVINPTAAHDAVVRAAQDVPSLLAGLAVLDPALSKQLTGKPLAQSTAPLGPLVGLGVGWFVSHYGLACTAVAAAGCWTQGTTDTVSAMVLAVCTVAGAYLGRLFASAPINGLFRSAPPPVSNQAAAALVAVQAATAPPPTPSSNSTIPVAVVGDTPAPTINP